MCKRFSYGSLSLLFGLTVLLLGGCGGGGGGGGGGGNITGGTTKVELGRKLFFDEDLSSEGNQSCASCHDPDHGFADPDASITDPVSEGSVTGAFGNRNAPTAAYASFIPDFGTLPAAQQQVSPEETPSKYRGGQFLDGRAKDLVEQAKGPFLNPAEMNLATKGDVVARVQSSSYANDFRTIYGAGAFDNTDTAYDNIADAIAAFEKSSELNPFTSKFDAYLLGQYQLSVSEASGLALFKDETKAKCANCHTLFDIDTPVPRPRSLFTNFKYYNVGTPVNSNTPTSLVVDEGLGNSSSSGNTNVIVADLPGERGKFRVPTLRNIELTGPYMHNGVYATLEEVIIHYDTFGGGGIIPEVAGNVPYDSGIADPLIADELEDITNESGLGLDSGPQVPNDYTDLVAFMKTLTDGYFTR